MARSFAKSLVQGTDEFEGQQRLGVEFVGFGPHRKAFGKQVALAEHREGRVEHRRQSLGQSHSPQPVSIFIPPTILHKMETVLDLPMPTDQLQQLPGRYSVG